MSAVDEQAAAVLVAHVQGGPSSPITERLIAMASEHGSVELRTAGGFVATYSSAARSLKTVGQLVAAVDSATVQYAMVLLHRSELDRDVDAATAQAERLLHGVEPGCVVIAGQDVAEASIDAKAPHRVVGREQEFRVCTAALAAARAGVPRTLTVIGDLGSGRTTMLEALMRQARTEGFAVVSMVGNQGSGSRRWSALKTATIVEPTADRPSRLADRVSSLSGEGSLDEAAIVQELLTHVSALADEHPLLVLVDDADHLDDASWSAVRAVSAGLAVERCLVVAAGQRAMDRSLEGTIVVLSELADAAVRVLIEGDGPIEARVLTRCVQLAGGNALAAREISRTLSSRQRAGLDPLPLVPEPAAAVLAGFRHLLADASEAAQRAAVVAAADDTADVTVVRAALSGLGEDVSGVEEAEAAGLLTITDGAVRFAHPLLRSVAYHHVAAGSRRAAHQALAAALHRPNQATARAYQLAEAAAGPSDVASTALVLVADTEVAHGDAAAAARACAAAARLTADEHLRDQRALRAAVLFLRAGDVTAAGGMLQELAFPESTTDVVVVRCMVDVALRGPAEAGKNLRRSASAGDPVADGLAALVDALAGNSPDERASPAPLTTVARVLAGTAPAAHLKHAERSAGVLGTLERSLSAPLLAAAGWVAEASQVLAELEIDPHLVDSLALHTTAGMVALESARPVAALSVLGDSGLLTGTLPADAPRLLALARARLYCGRLDDAEQSLREAAVIIDRAGLGVHQPTIDALYGLILHARGEARGLDLLGRAAQRRPDQALPELVVATLDRNGTVDPTWEADLRRLAESSDRRVAWSASRALAALSGDFDGLEATRVRFEAAGLQLEAILTEGVLTSTAARLGVPSDRRPVRQHPLATGGIVCPGSRYWAEGTAQNRLREKLSPAEHRVAVVVGTGATNKEVSSQLFISVKTVDYHLQNIYRKLGARSRTELAVLLAGSDVDTAEANHDGR